MCKDSSSMYRFAIYAALAIRDALAVLNSRARADCTIDVDTCVDGCGNGDVEGGEECDGANLNGVHFRPEGGRDARTLLLLWTYHLEPTEAVFPPRFDPHYAEVVLLPGDPNRATRIAARFDPALAKSERRSAEDAARRARFDHADRVVLGAGDRRDAATERAIHKSSPLPKPGKPELFSRTLELRFRPQED